MPLSRGDTVFVYLSPAFLSKPVEPALPDRIAAPAAFGRGDRAVRHRPTGGPRRKQKPDGTIDELVAGGFLPAGFGRAADGSRLELVDGKLADSLRGGQGTFSAGPRRRGRHRSRRPRPPSIVASPNTMRPSGDRWIRSVAIGRKALPDGQLGTGGDRLRSRAAVAEAHSICCRNGSARRPTSAGAGSRRRRVVRSRAARRNVSSRRRASFVRRLARRRSGHRARSRRPASIARLLTSQWKACKATWALGPMRAFCGCSGGVRMPARRGRVLALADRIVAASVRPFHAAVVPSGDPGAGLAATALRERPSGRRRSGFGPTIWRHSKLAPMLNAYGYRQSRQITLGNTRFMNMLNEQLHVPPPSAGARPNGCSTPS